MSHSSKEEREKRTQRTKLKGEAAQTEVRVVRDTFALLKLSAVLYIELLHFTSSIYI